LYEFLNQNNLRNFNLKYFKKKIVPRNLKNTHYCKINTFIKKSMLIAQNLKKIILIYGVKDILLILDSEWRDECIYFTKI